MKHYSWFFTVLVSALLLLSGCNFGRAQSASAAAAPTATAVPATAVAAAPANTAPAAAVTTAIPANSTLTALEGTLEQIYTNVDPSVVNIQVTEKMQATSSQAIPEIPGFPFFPPSPFQGPQQAPAPLQGSGSGFVWDKSGDIVTNNHVVDGASTITVTFSDGTTVPAKVVGTDPDSDLAVVKVDMPADRLQPVQLADSTQVKVGQLVVAIGNPFALQGTMTVGFVSAMGRLLPVDASNAQGPGYTIPDIIQTDAAINPGNSGGVLVNDQGQVIGVTSAIISPVRASAGIGFAIPSAIVQKVVPALISTGHYDHVLLGVSGTTLSPDMASAMNLQSSQRGALVVDVVPGSPADQAGLQGSTRQIDVAGQTVRVGGDVIVAIDGQPVKNFDDVITYLTDNTKVGQTITLTVLRQGKQEMVKVTLAARPQPQAQQGQTAGMTNGAFLGLSGLTITPEIGKALGLPAGQQQGILIEQIQQGSPADQAGLQGSYKPTTIAGHQVLVGGDIIIGVDGQPISQMQDLATLVQMSQPGQDMTLTVLRNGQQVDVPVTLGQMPTATPQ